MCFGQQRRQIAVGEGFASSSPKGGAGTVGDEHADTAFLVEDALLNEESLPAFAEIMAALAQGAVHYEAESVNLDLAGERKDVLVHINVAPGYEQSLGKTIVSIQDTTAR